MAGSNRAKLMSQFLSPIDTEQLVGKIPPTLAISDILLEGVGSFLTSYRQAWNERQKALLEKEQLKTAIANQQLQTKILQANLLTKMPKKEDEEMRQTLLDLRKAQTKAQEALAKQRLTPRPPTPKSATPLSPEAIYRNAATHFNNWYRMNKKPELSEQQRAIWGLPIETQEDKDKEELELVNQYKQLFPDYGKILFVETIPKTKEPEIPTTNLVKKLEDLANTIRNTTLPDSVRQSALNEYKRLTGKQ